MNSLSRSLPVIAVNDHEMADLRDVSSIVDVNLVGPQLTERKRKFTTKSKTTAGLQIQRGAFQL